MLSILQRYLYIHMYLVLLQYCFCSCLCVIRTKMILQCYGETLDRQEKQNTADNTGSTRYQFNTSGKSMLSNQEGHVYLNSVAASFLQFKTGQAKNIQPNKPAFFSLEGAAVHIILFILDQYYIPPSSQFTQCIL